MILEHRVHIMCTKPVGDPGKQSLWSASRRRQKSARSLLPALRTRQLLNMSPSVIAVARRTACKAAGLARRIVVIAYFCWPLEQGHSRYEAALKSGSQRQILVPMLVGKRLSGRSSRQRCQKGALARIRSIGPPPGCRIRNSSECSISRGKRRAGPSA